MKHACDNNKEQGAGQPVPMHGKGHVAKDDLYIPGNGNGRDPYKEEPRLVRAGFSEEETPKTIPDYESVNLLRLARQNKNIPTEDFADLRQSVFNGGKEAKEVRAQIKQILLGQEEAKDPVEVRRSRRNTAIRRLIGILSHTKKELESEALLPAYLLKQIADLTAKLEDQLE